MIALGKMDASDVIAQLPFEFLCPQQVKIEIETGAAKGYAVKVPNWFNVLPLATPLSPLILAGLDRGEAEVIQLALEQGIGLVCIDETQRPSGGCGRRLTSSRLTRPNCQSESLWLDSRRAPFD